MKKIQKIEVVGLGEIELYGLKPQQQEFKPVNEAGEELTKKTKEAGKYATYVYVDESDKEYSSDEVFYNVGGKIIQKVKKTEKINDFDIVEKSDILGDFMSDGYYICDCSETTLKNWDKEVGQDKAISFVLKKSSRGLKFHRAYVLKFQNHLVLFAGAGKISDGIKEFEKLKENKKDVEVSISGLKDVVEVKAEELVITI